MKVKGFMSYIGEAIGANSMELDPVGSIIQPDTKKASAIMFNQGTSGSVPTHWNNSPFLSGGRLTSAFGMNPRINKKKAVLSYTEFIKTSKKMGERNNKEV